MSKLPAGKQFLDLSDYARPLARILVKVLLPTKVGAYSLTFLFLICGIIAAYLILTDRLLWLSAILLIVKSMLDAADGEIARRRNHPSMVGRYMDSVFDFIVNLILFLSVATVFNQSYTLMTISLLLFQMQGSVFNYYYLVKRYQAGGDKTSRIFEISFPKPYERDNLILLHIFHKLYIIIYAWQDYIIYKLDSKAINGRELPPWFLTMVSLMGLGTQLLIIALLVAFDSHQYVLYFFTIPYTILAITIIFIRKLLVR